MTMMIMSTTMMMNHNLFLYYLLAVVAFTVAQVNGHPSPFSPFSSSSLSSSSSSSSSTNSSLSSPPLRQASRRRPFVCGTEDPSPDVLATIQHLQSLNSNRNKNDDGDPQSHHHRRRRRHHHGSNARRTVLTGDDGPRSLNISTWFHLVSSADRKDTITPGMLEHQVGPSLFLIFF